MSIPWRELLTKDEVIAKWIGIFYFGKPKYGSMLQLYTQKDKYDWYLCGIDYQNGHIQYTHLEYEERKEN